MVRLEHSVYEINEESVDYRHATVEKDHHKDFLEKLKSNFEINILENNDNGNELIFEMKNIDVSFANALRRIMISEVSTMAIEHIYMWNNSSIIPDEVLSHRLGLIPLSMDPRYFTAMDEDGKDEDGEDGKEDNPTDRNTVVFRLKVACPKQRSSMGGSNQESSKSNNTTDNNDSIMENTIADRAAESTVANYELEQSQLQDSTNAPTTPNIAGRPYTKHVYSKDLLWIPQGDQENRLPFKIKPIHDDILIAKLRPGQMIELEAHARVSNGKDHAKFSPVATATYRLMPNIQITQDIYDEYADELIMYEPGVFKIVPLTDDSNGHYQKAIVSNPYACTMSRNFMRNEFLKNAIKMSRLENHFIFSIESVGMLPACIILAESLKILKEKAQNLERLLEDYTDGSGL